ncbi:MAG: sigma factor [Burkholderiaceae bacterium]
MNASHDAREARYRALLERMQRQDESAMRELHGLVGRRIVAFAMNRLGDDDMAQTVMIDTLYEVWQHPDRFRGESRFETWVLGIAKYKVLNQLRGIRRDLATSPTTRTASRTTRRRRPNMPRPPIARKSFRNAWIDSRRYSANAMHLVYYEGFDVAEVAEVQGAPSGTIKTRLMHGRRNMRTCLERHGVEVDHD